MPNDPGSDAPRASPLPASPSPPSLGAALLDEARQAGLLDDKTEHVSFRAPKALIDVAGEPFIGHQLRLLRQNGVRRVVVCAARRETGLRSTTELGLAALAILARPDPVAEAMKRTRGTLGHSHTLEY